MITCPKCSKENQDHYKFCLGCGAELPRSAAPKKFTSGTPPQGIPAVKGGAGIADEPTHVGPGKRSQPAPAPAAPAAAFTAPAPPAPVLAPIAAPSAAGAPPVACADCGHSNPATNRFCASCGAKLSAKAVSVPAPAPAAPAAAPAPSSSATPTVVLTALRADGSEAGSYTLPSGTVTIGRDTGAIFAGDSYLSPRHATFIPKGGKLVVRDESSLNGIYKKLRRDEPQVVHPGNVFRIGQEIIRFETLAPAPSTADGVERLGSPSKGYVGRISLIIGRDAAGNTFPVPETGLHLGRERGDVLFPEDGYVSGLHCRVSYEKGQLFITDLGSSNGTFIRLSADGELIDGDVLLMGQQLFRVNINA
ncbi:FHA domain-containing protein [Polyangium aurulentum]|uniref:FHA domain-containing protein n=1 Tax=Polyangium aurulentum TaxID=2567896 RepID=UPI0010AEAE3F|nr:FHA domain-containing protein [Polyangium aurulentum]UQA59125.1 FHA domain-containing protein [Polyangium aurulentum]